MVGVEGWLDVRRVDVMRKKDGGDEGDSWYRRRERETNDEKEKEKQVKWRTRSKRSL